jgi:hypothetical protein
MYACTYILSVYADVSSLSVLSLLSLGFEVRV